MAKKPLRTILVVLCVVVLFGCEPASDSEKQDQEQVSQQGQEELFADEWQMMSEEIAELGPWLMSQPDVLREDPQVVLDGYRYLSMLLYAGLKNHLLNADTDRPKFITNFDDLVGYTGDHRDGIYRTANIDPNGTYRVVTRPQGGLPATATLQTMTGFWQPGLGGKTVLTKNLYDFSGSSDGSYEIIFSKEQQGVNHFPLDDIATGILMREYTADDEKQKPFALTIERIDQPLTVPKESDSQQSLNKKIDNAVGMVKVVATQFLNLTRICRSEINGIKLLEDASAFGGSQENKYYMGSWELDDDEALVIEVKPIEAAYWSISGLNFWAQGLSHSDIPGEINNYGAVVDPDNYVRIVVSHEDPGYANWISTGGLRVGLLLGRFNFIKEEEQVTYSKINIQEIEEVMASNSAKVTPEERVRQLEKTRMGVLRRYNR